MRDDTLRILCGAALAATLVATPAAAAPALAGSTLQRIEAAHAAGLIDAEQRVLYRLYRVVDRERLPPALVAPADEERPLRCGTPLVREAIAARAWLSPAGAAAVEAALPAPLPARSEQYTSTNFALIVGEDGGVEQGTIDAWLDTLEEVWSAEVDTHGFAAPPCTDQHYFDVYLGNTGGDVPTIENDVYGYVTHYGNDCPYMVVHDTYPGGWGAAQVTAAHEFQHGIQSGYDWWEGDWWMEATAVWAEELVYPDVDDYLQYLNGGGWMDYPEYSLYYEDGWHEYGNVAWILYLDEYEGGPVAIRDMWERCAQVDADVAMDDILQDGGSSLPDAFVDFTAHLTGHFFEDGDLWSPIWVTRSHASYPVDGAIAQYLPQRLGSNYVEFLPDGGGATTLEVTFEGDDGTVDFGMALVAFQGGSADYDAVIGGGPLTLTVADFGGDVDKVVMAVSALSEEAAGPGSAGEPYSYQATLGGASGDDDAGDDDGGAGDGQGYGCGCRVDGTPAARPLAVMLLLGAIALRRATR